MEAITETGKLRDTQKQLTFLAKKYEQATDPVTKKRVMNKINERLDNYNQIKEDEKNESN